MQAAPYIDTADDYLANACSFGLVLVLQVCIIFKLGTLVEIKQVWERMGHEQQTVSARKPQQTPLPGHIRRFEFDALWSSVS